MPLLYTSRRTFLQAKSYVNNKTEGDGEERGNRKRMSEIIRRRSIINTCMLCMLRMSRIGPYLSSSGGFLERSWYFFISSGKLWRELITEEEPPEPPKIKENNKSCIF